MANKEGFKAAEVGHMIAHYARTPDKETGRYQDYPRRAGGGVIDAERTHKNYQIGECHSAAWVHERLKTVYQRPQDKGHKPVMLDVVVTLPKDESKENAEQFFRASYDSLVKQFGGRDNIVGAWVHMDEAQPHMHFSFLPIADKRMKSRPEVREGISQAKYFPTKGSLRMMHEILQRDVSGALGHTVSILNGATLEGNKSISELRAETAKRIEYARGNYADLEKMVEGLEEVRRLGIMGDKLYRISDESLYGILKLAEAGATAGLTEDERQEELRAAQSKVARLERDRELSQDMLTGTMKKLGRIEREAAPFLRVPEQFRHGAEVRLENMRNQYLDRADDVNRSICRAFLQCGRDFNKTVATVSPTLSKMGVDQGKQRQYVRECLREVAMQYRRSEKAEKGGKAYTPPVRGGGWTPSPKETDYSIPEQGQRTPVMAMSVPMPAGTSISWWDWLTMDEEEKKRVMEKMKQERGGM